MKSFCVGTEIECIVNNKYNSDIEVGDYHDGIPLMIRGMESDSWFVESDSSLSSWNNPFNFPTCMEFVSSIARSKKSFFSMLSEFQERLSHGEYELNEVLHFNKSCGCHIHFSIKGFIFRKKVVYDVYPLVRKYFFKLLDESDISSKEDIKNHYFRNYALKLTKKSWENVNRAEFNLQDESRGLEWRGFNLLGITTWKEFYEMFEIAFKVLEYLYELSKGYEINKSYLINNKYFRDDLSYKLRSYNYNLNKDRDESIMETINLNLKNAITEHIGIRKRENININQDEQQDIPLSKDSDEIIEINLRRIENV